MATFVLKFYHRTAKLHKSLSCCNASISIKFSSGVGRFVDISICHKRRHYQCSSKAIQSYTKKPTRAKDSTGKRKIPGFLGWQR